MRLLVDLGNHVHVPTDFTNHGVHIINFVHLLLLLGASLLPRLQLLYLIVLLFDHIQEVADLAGVIVPH